MGRGSTRIELFERGYGKDAAGIAKDAITYGELRLEMKLTGSQREPFRRRPH
jgi:hypothetical protein